VKLCHLQSGGWTFDATCVKAGFGGSGIRSKLLSEDPKTILRSQCQVPISISSGS